MVNGLGERLQKQRNIHKLSQKDVANTLHVSPSVISNYESGERTPSVEILMALANLYRCSVNTMLDVSMLNTEQRILLQHFLLSIHSV